MAHYAKVLDGIVTQVIVVESDFLDTFVDSSPGEWIQCSFNVQSGIYYVEDESGSRNPAENQEEYINDDYPERKRKNFPGIGFTYDKQIDAFIPPKPYESWVLNTSMCEWFPPTEEPNDGKDYVWDESTTSWKEFIGPPRP